MARFVAVPAPSLPPAPSHPPSRRLIWLLTVATGASVANLYYNQPLLSDIARTFQASSRAAGAIATLTQAGYAVGLLLFVPLGDVMERRRLIVTLLDWLERAGIERPYVTRQTGDHHLRLERGDDACSL